MNYKQKLNIANHYLFGICGMSWNDLPDINSLHNAETKDDIVELCQERLIDSGFPEDLLSFPF